MRNPVHSIVNALKEELTCALCQDVYVKPQALIPCLHTFCLECVCSIPRENYIGALLNCPICRGVATEYVNNYSTQNIVDIFTKAELDLDAESSTQIIASLSIEQPQQTGESSSSTTTATTEEEANIERKAPCRSCERNNGTNYRCAIPITESNQSGDGHIFCFFCSEHLPARGPSLNEPALNQCCSFCGTVACDEYWGCKNRDKIAKLYILNEITSIKQYLIDVDEINLLEDGHLNLTEIKLLEDYLHRSQLTWSEAWSTCLADFNDNHYTTPLARRMTPLATQLYNTRRLTSVENNEDEDYSYYDNIAEEGISPSNHLRACYSCAVTMINGQFYGYWKEVLENGLARDYRPPCPQGTACQAQWRTETHAERLSHMEASVEDESHHEFFECL